MQIAPPLFTLGPVYNQRRDAGAAHFSLVIILEEAKSNATRTGRLICLVQSSAEARRK